jgi:hypothetical protein
MLKSSEKKALAFMKGIERKQALLRVFDTMRRST